MKRSRKVEVPGFEVFEVRGTGAMATVYRALQTGLDRPVALKVLHDDVAKDDDYRERFLREARAAARLTHRNLVRVYEAGVHEGRYWLAMELIEGEDLGERLTWTASLTEAEALDVAIQVARALEAAEAAGLVHRDVKPENILLGDDGVVRLGDLGLAKVRGDASITADGITLGTVAYLSPEQCRGARDLDIRSDLFALGAVLYTALTGEPPYGRGENAVVTMKRIIREDAPPLEARAKVSPATAAAVRTLMARDREARPGTAREAVALLEATRAEVLGDAEPRGSSGERRGLRPRRRRGAVAARGGGGGGALALVTIVAVALGAGVAAGVALRAQPAPGPGGGGRADPALVDPGVGAPRAPASPAAGPGRDEAPDAPRDLAPPRRATGAAGAGAGDDGRPGGDADPGDDGRPGEEAPGDDGRRPPPPATRTPAAPTEGPGGGLRLPPPGEPPPPGGGLRLPTPGEPPPRARRPGGRT